MVGIKNCRPDLTPVSLLLKQLILYIIKIYFSGRIITMAAYHIERSINGF